jgi:hypothetical protein
LIVFAKYVRFAEQDGGKDGLLPAVCDIFLSWRSAVSSQNSVLKDARSPSYPFNDNYPILEYFEARLIEYTKTMRD